MMIGSTGFDAVSPVVVPADRPELFVIAAASGADAIVLDLECSVPPRNKTTARNNLRSDFTTLPVFVRINAVGTPWHHDDLGAVQFLKISAIFLPKATYSQCIDRVSSRHRIVALIETAAGLIETHPIASHPNVSRLAFCSKNFSEEVGCSCVREPLLAARSEIVYSSQAAGLAAPLDSVICAPDDPEGVASDAKHLAQLGFGGQICFDPFHIPAVRRGMMPSDQEVEWARGILGSSDDEIDVGFPSARQSVRRRALRLAARAGLIYDEMRDPPGINARRP